MSIQRVSMVEISIYFTKVNIKKIIVIIYYKIKRF